MDAGICVKVVQKLDRNGNTVCVASHKRDSKTTYRVSMQAKYPIEVLEAWMNKFTGISEYVRRHGITDRPGFLANFKIVAAGTDFEGQYFVLVVTSYNCRDFNGF